MWLLQDANAIDEMKGGLRDSCCVKSLNFFDSMTLLSKGYHDNNHIFES